MSACQPNSARSVTPKAPRISKVRQGASRARRQPSSRVRLVRPRKWISSPSWRPARKVQSGTRTMALPRQRC
ncbi:hypothetical protein D3C75_1050150 [compost metagenome]